MLALRLTRENLYWIHLSVYRRSRTHRNSK